MPRPGEPTTMRIELLALDLDGTALDPEGKLRPTVRDAIVAAQERGVWVVLATGRRFRTALPAARDLGLCGPVVVNNGVLVKDIDSAATLHQHYLSRDLYVEVVEMLREAVSPMVYVDAFPEPVEIVIEPRERAHPFQQEYLRDNVENCRVVTDLVAPPPEEVILISTMGEDEALRRLREKVHERFGERVRTNSLVNKNYRGHILELLAPASGKWAMLERLAQARGIHPQRIAALGDDRNDVEMIRRAGVGIAMGNAIAEAREAADWVTGSNDEDGVVEALERLELLD